LCEVAEGCIKKIDENITHFKKIIPGLFFNPLPIWFCVACNAIGRGKAYYQLI
jgi:hypothetical protein